jgi:epoxide hydrolase 4
MTTRSALPLDEPGQTVQVGSLSVHYIERGQGPLVLLLHGFPECWWGWRRQIEPLAADGLRVVVPDLRGYNRTSRPTDGYDIDTLTADVMQLVLALGERRCSLVGHDWGGVIAWLTAMRFPDLVERLAILNAPHPGTYLRELRHPDQLTRSWYVALFGIPRLSEWLLARSHCAGVEGIMRSSSTRPDTFSRGELGAHRDMWCQPGALTAALSYYRQALLLGPRRAPPTFTSDYHADARTLGHERRRALPSAFRRPGALGAQRPDPPIPRRRPLDPARSR